MIHPEEDFERAGRQKKVFAIVPVLIKAGVSASQLEAQQNESFWDCVHVHCKLSHTSETTRRMVLKELREHEQDPAQDDIRDGEAAAKERAYRRARAEEMD